MVTPKLTVLLRSNIDYIRLGKKIQGLEQVEIYS